MSSLGIASLTPPPRAKARGRVWGPLPGAPDENAPCREHGGWIVAGVFALTILGVGFGIFSGWGSEIDDHPLGGERNDGAPERRAE